MNPPRWIEQPRALAVLTLAFALVPACFAFLSFQAARERDARLFDTAAAVLGEQLKLSTFKEVSFLNVLRNQWRFIEDQSHPGASRLPPGGWTQRHPHLLAVVYAGYTTETSIPVLWQDGRSPQTRLAQNLAAEESVASLLAKARTGPAHSVFASEIAGERLVMASAVPDTVNLQIVRGYVLGWIDLKSLCNDPSLPLIAHQVLRAGTAHDGGRAVEISGESEVKWTAWISRGPEFSREYGTPTPWIGFAALGLSVLPLSLLVMLASRAGKLRAALESEQLKNQFVSTVSHEFRTPLSVILSGAELLEVHAASLSESRRAELLTQIKTSTTRMNDMVEQVLLLGRLESGAMMSHPEPVDLAALCRDVIAEVQTATQHRCEIETQLPAGTRLLDAALIRSVLTNLLMNAVKYSRPGGKVTLETSASDVIISDEGVGIPPHDQTLLGKPFHRAANVGEVAGTGLGLTIVQRCLALCGGTLSISSEEGRGTRVVVSLPS